MTYQNLNRLPIISGPLTTYTIERNVFGEEPQAAGWFIVEHSAIDNDTYILPSIFGTRAEASAALDDILA